MSNTISLRLSESDTIELPIVHDFSTGLVLAGTDEQGYEIVHTASGLGLIDGSSEFRARLMDYGRAFSQLRIDWSCKAPLEETSNTNKSAALRLKALYWDGFEAPKVNYVKE